MNKQMQVIGFDDKKYARTGFPQIIESKIPWLFPDFFQNFKFPWLNSKFPDFSLTLKFF